MLTVVILVAVAAVAWVVVATLWLWRNQERVVFQPPNVVAPDPAGIKRVPLASGAFAYVVEPKTPATPSIVVVAFHGNADLALWTVPWAQELAHRAGATVVVAEYRGYAGIPGTPSYESAAEDARGVAALARSLHPGRLVYFGHSLGTAIATELASRSADKPDALVLQSPFTSARDMAYRMLVPAFAAIWKTISRVPYDTKALVRELDVPVSVAHGSLDITIPVRMGRDVSAASLRKGNLLVVPGAGHNDVADVGGEAYWRWLAEAVTGKPASAPVTELEQKGGRRLP